MFIHWRRAKIKEGEITCLNRHELGSVFSSDIVNFKVKIRSEKSDISICDMSYESELIQL